MKLRVGVTCSEHLCTFVLLFLAVLLGLGILPKLPVSWGQETFALSQATIDDMARRFGSRARSRLQDWVSFVNDSRGLSDQDALAEVNTFFNRRIRYVEDIRHWNKNDYWATPQETLASRGGDCEDFAIAKYYTLREWGLDDNKLRIVYVRSSRLRRPHMVLAYYSQPGADPLILDSITSRISPASKRRDLTPVYSFNGSRLWTRYQRGQGQLGGARRLRNWRYVTEKMRRAIIH